MPRETEEDRQRREHQRTLFDGVARTYDATRQTYPAEVVDKVVETARLGAGSAVLEIGCGTGQLTRQLAGRGAAITAIDIGEAMVDIARTRISDPRVSFEVSSFEDFAGSGPFDVIVSATAFHWVDPAVAYSKTARLLRPGGWLALLTTGERYPEPLRTAMRELWTRYSRLTWGTKNQPRWATSQRDKWVGALQESGLFGTVVELTHEQRLQLSRETALGVESTRATYLSFSGADQGGFLAELEGLLPPDLELIQESVLVIAPTLD